MLVVLGRKEQYLLGRTTGITPAVVEVDCMEAAKLVHSLEVRWGEEGPIVEDIKSSRLLFFFSFFSEVFQRLSRPKD